MRAVFRSVIVKQDLIAYAKSWLQNHSLGFF